MTQPVSGQGDRMLGRSLLTLANVITDRRLAAFVLRAGQVARRERNDEACRHRPAWWPAARGGNAKWVIGT